MKTITQTANKIDFIKFLTNEETHIYYNDRLFTKEVNGSLIIIKSNGELIYKVHKEKKVLIVIKALYMTFLRDEYWGIAKAAGLEEIIADPNTLIRI
ncbi:MAG: hypothetical protein ACRDDX_16095 [Cellulosilyticaceae bacterium]